MEFVPENGGQPPPGECASMILPALSIGNVGQLAVNLLISTWRTGRVGFLDDPNVLPCVGNDPHGPVPSGDLALPREAYASGANSSGMMLIQQRSPVVKGMMMEFAKNLADFAASSGKKDVVILSGLDFGRWQRIDTSGGSQTYYLSSVKSDGYDDRCENFGWKRLSEYNPNQRSWNYVRASAEGDSDMEEGFPGDDDLEEEDYCPSLLCSFLLLQSERAECDLLAMLLLGRGQHTRCFPYCRNSMQALRNKNCSYWQVACLKKSFTSCEGDGWLIPYSWKTLYGPPPDVSIF